MNRYSFFLIRFCWSGVAHRTHDFFANNFGFIRKIDAVVFVIGFRHFGASIQSWYFYQLFAKAKSNRFGEVLSIVHIIKAYYKISGHFQMLLLIFSNRHHVCFVDDDVGCHQSGIGKQACINIVWLTSDLVFKRGNTL